jgi:hypothetical protein
MCRYFNQVVECVKERRMINFRKPVLCWLAVRTKEGRQKAKK